MLGVYPIINGFLIFFQCGDCLYTSESDVYRRQILTYKHASRAERGQPTRLADILIKTVHGILHTAQLNAGKTQLIVFSVGPKPELIDLELFGEPIIQIQTAKLLGILFDRRLSFKDHMKDLMTKVYRRLNLLKLLKGTNWGARPYTILKAYKCFIRPVLEYGSLITGALRESQVKEMQIFQNKCLRLALGVTYLDRMRTIDLHDLTNVPMIKTRMTALAVKTFKSLENTQCFKDLVLNHEIVQKRSGSNTILDQLLAEIQADA